MSLILAGDVSLHGNILSPDYKITEGLGALQIALDQRSLFCNLESPVIGDNIVPQNEKYIFTTSECAKEASRLLNIKAVSIANNHILEYGESGLRKTIEFLKENEICYTGAGTEKSDLDPVFFDVNNETIALIAYVHKDTNIRNLNSNHLLLNKYDEAEIVEVIRDARKVADKVLLSLHWGRDYSRYPMQWQRDAAIRFVDAGASIIAGHHPHTIQPYEKIGDSWVFYSMGSLIFGDFIKDGELRALRRSTKDSFIADTDMDFRSIKLIATREKKGNKLVLTNKNISPILKKRMRNWLYFRKHIILLGLFEFFKQFTDRLTDYFFGYYRNPIKDLFSIRFIRKIKFLKSDIAKSFKL